MYICLYVCIWVFETECVLIREGTGLEYIVGELGVVIHLI